MKSAGEGPGRLYQGTDPAGASDRGQSIPFEIEQDNQWRDYGIAMAS
jgi:hypothetical protein